MVIDDPLTQALGVSCPTTRSVGQNSCDVNDEASPDLFLFLKTCDASMEEIQKHINTHFPDGHSNQPASLLSEL